MYILEAMKVKYLVIIVLLLCSFQSVCKDRRFYGRVINGAGDGIPNATLQAKDRNEVFYCNSKGIFSFRANTDSIDAFWVICLGYEKEAVFVEDMATDSIFITLQKSNTYLRSASISAKGRRQHESIAGSGKSAHGSGCYLTIHDEIALFLETDAALNATLKEVNVYVTKEGASTNKFLLRVYKKDTVTGGPGEEITDTILILNADRGKEWVGADLSEKLIPVHGGVFVSVTWIAGYGNDDIPWPLKENNYYSGEDSLRLFFNGPVLGLTWLAGPQPVVYRRYARNIYENSDEGKWYRTPPHNGGHRLGQWITPMIYLTYTYLER